MKRVTVVSVLVAASVAMGTSAAAVWLGSKPINRALHGRCAAPSSHAGPHVVLFSTRYDLGAMPSGAPLVARFTVRNDGARRLIVRRLHAACCGYAEQEQATIIAPGESSELTVTAEVLGHHGRWERTIAYTTNDPAQPRFELTVLANIVARM